MESDENRSPRHARGCGCQAAAAFLILVGLPVLVLFSFGLSPCADGPCDPNGARNLRIAAAAVAVGAALIGLSVWWAVGWWARRQAARGRPATVPKLLLAVPLLLAAALLFVLLFR